MWTIGKALGICSGWERYRPTDVNSVLVQDGDEMCEPVKTPTKCAATRVLDRPVLWEWSGKPGNSLEQLDEM